MVAHGRYPSLYTDNGPIAAGAFKNGDGLPLGAPAVGTHERKTPAGTLIARRYCRKSHTTFSLLPCTGYAASVS